MFKVCLVWLTKPFCEIITPTKAKNALRNADANFFLKGFGGSLRSRFSFMNFFRGFYIPNVRELTLR